MFLPSVFLPGLVCTPRLYAEQVSALWAFGPVMVGDHTRDDSVAAIAQRVLANAPPRFALIGLSMGGYISMEILRQAPERVAKLALLDTTARPDTPEQTAGRREMIALARSGRFGEVFDRQYPMLVAPARQSDQDLRRVVRTMAEQVGPEAFER